MTRPNIAFVVSVVSQFKSAPIVRHWEALGKILGFMKGVPGLGILYSNHDHTSVFYTC